MASNNRLIDDESLVYKLSTLEELPDIIEIESQLPTLFNVHAMLVIIKRWHELSRAFNRPVRIYVVCANREVEKCVQRLISEHDSLFLTVLPHKKNL